MELRIVLHAIAVGSIAVAGVLGVSTGVASAGPADTAAVDAAVEAATPVTDPATPGTDPVTPVTNPVTPVTTPDGPVEPSDGIDWLPIVVIVGALLVIVAVAAALLRRRPDAASASTSAAQPATAASRVQTNLLTTAQWIHDQLSLELLASDPIGAQQRWMTERSRVDDVVIGCQQQFAGNHGTGWQQLGQSLAALATAIDSNIHLRVQPGADASVVSESNAVVNRQRGTLQQVLTALWSVTPR